MKIRTEIPLKTEELKTFLPSVGANIFFPTNFPITDHIGNIVTDSKDSGSGDLFFPLAKDPSERARHTAEAINRGAAVITDQYGVPPSNGDTVLLKVAGLYKRKITDLLIQKMN